MILRLDVSVEHRLVEDTHTHTARERDRQTDRDIHDGNTT